MEKTASAIAALASINEKGYPRTCVLADGQLRR